MQKGKPKEFSSGSLSHLNRITNIMVLKKTEQTFSQSPTTRVSVPTKCMCPQDTKSSYYRDPYTSMFMAAQFTIVKSQNQPGCPSADRGRKEMWRVSKRDIPHLHRRITLCYFQGNRQN